MSFPVFTYSDATGVSCPFDGKFWDDTWVVYHGTGNLAERSIKAEGIVWRPSTYSEAEVSEVSKTFEDLGWIGHHPGGYAVVKTFTKNDFEAGSTGDTKRVYLAETSYLALLLPAPISPAARPRVP